VRRLQNVILPFSNLFKRTIRLYVVDLGRNDVRIRMSGGKQEDGVGDERSNNENVTADEWSG